MKPDYLHIEELATQIRSMNATFNIDCFDDQVKEIEVALENLLEAMDDESHSDKYLRIRYPHGVPLL